MKTSPHRGGDLEGGFAKREGGEWHSGGRYKPQASKGCKYPCGRFLLFEAGPVAELLTLGYHPLAGDIGAIF